MRRETFYIIYRPLVRVPVFPLLFPPPLTVPPQHIHKPVVSHSSRIYEQVSMNVSHRLSLYLACSVRVQQDIDRVVNSTPKFRTLAPSLIPSVCTEGTGRLCFSTMSASFRLFKSCSTVATVSRSRAGTRLITFMRPGPGVDRTTLHVGHIPSSTLDSHSLFFVGAVTRV